MKPFDVIALDLEGTLISDARHCVPRRHLHWFLQQCAGAAGLVMVFSSVLPERVWRAQSVLVKNHAAPKWFSSVEQVRWAGPVKDLRFTGVAVARAVLVDDCGAWVHPQQRHRWVEVTPFAYPFEADDALLAVWSRVRDLAAAGLVIDDQAAAL